MTASITSSDQCTIPPLSEFKAVIFDLDGTLLDTETLSDRALIAAFGDLLPEYVRREGRIPWALKKQILGLRGNDWIPIAIRYAQEHWGVEKVNSTETTVSSIPSLEEFSCLWEDNLNALCSEIEACPGALELVQKMAAAGYPLGIATSSRKSAVEKKSKRHRLMFENMKAVVTGDHPAVKNGKPAPDIYLEAAKQLGVAPTTPSTQG